MIVGDLGLGSVSHPDARVGHVAICEQVTSFPVVEFHNTEQQVARCSQRESHL